MRRYIWQKTGSFLVTAVLVSLITFLVVQILPGDPALLMLGTEGSPEAYARLKAELRLEEPALKRYGSWLADFVQGRWGMSLRYSLPVQQLVWQAFPLSFGLSLIAVAVALALATPAGMLMAAKPIAWSSRLIGVGSQIGMALPQFWVGLLLIQFFAVRWHLLPAGGSSGWSGLILPTLTLALPRAAILSRLVRVGMAEALQKEYIRTARAKGLPRAMVFFKHALRNGALGVLTVAGLQFSQLLAGTIVVEQVFGLPGLGQLLLAGVLQRDIPLVQALVMLVVVLILIFELIFDLCLGLLDPRLRYE